MRHRSRARADIYLKELGALGFFGYESPDPGQGNARSQYGYMVIDDDYAPTEYPGFADPLDAAKVTFAHEFNHLLQQNYDSFQDVWMFESTATWSEDHVYPEINDWVGYIQAFAQSPGTPITDRKAAKGLKIYGSTVWNHWLATGGGGFGVEAIRRAWEVSDVVNPADLATSAYDKAIRDRGGKGFSREFVRFLVRTTEWRSGYGGFPDAPSYPEMKRKGQLGKGQERQITLDHTAARLFNVNAGGDRIKLTVRAEDGVRAGLALVGRDGDVLTGSVTKRSTFLDQGGRTSVKLSSPGRFERITAVVVNADGRVKGFAAGDWVYKTDNREFSASLSG